MNKITTVLLIGFYLLFWCASFAGEIDTLNTKNSNSKFRTVSASTNSYIVYLQDSINGLKYNFEIWERTLMPNDNNGANTLIWKRHKNQKGEHYHYSIKFDNSFRPIEERITSKRIVNQEEKIEKSYFMYDGNRMFTSSDSLLHTTKSFFINDLQHSFNWELDLEILASLPLEENKVFALCFYHPGSKSLPNYYLYAVNREEKLCNTGKCYDCWVLNVEYSAVQKSEFWIDKESHTVIQMKESFYGKFRFKRLII